MIEIFRKLTYLLSRREQLHAALLFALMLIGATLEMLGVGAIPAFVSLLSDPAVVLRYELVRDVYEWLGITSKETLVLYAAVGLLAIFSLKNLFLALLAYLQMRYTYGRFVGIASRLFNAYLRGHYTFHLQRNTAELLRNANQEAEHVAGHLLLSGLRMLMEIMVVAGILFLLIVTEPVISIVVLVILGGASVLFYCSIRRRLSKYGKQEQDCRGKMIQSINEGLGGLKVIKVLGRESHFLNVYVQNARGFAKSGKFKGFMFELPRLYLETVAVLGLLATAVLLLVQGRPVESFIPTLSLLAVAVVRMIPSFNRITTSIASLRYGRYALDVVYEDLHRLNEAAETRRAENGRPLVLPFRKIRLENVQYRYPGATEFALEGITLEIPQGSAVGFVGPTGAGKTTLVDVILGLLEPVGGKILIDGQDMRQRVEAWQRQVGYIPQEIYLADNTIRRNIAFGLDDDAIDEQAVQRAVAAAKLGDLIEQLPDGLGTVVGDRGVRLSGGQRQRVGIARALYHGPQVLVMDEGTSALDNETERYIMQAVEHLQGERTLIMIAHRLSSVRSCDRLFFLQDGRLEAEGTYDELLQTNQGFQRLAV